MTAETSRAGGFTLVEMLVALLLASLLAVVVGTGLFLGVRSWEGIQRHQANTADAYVIQQALRRILGGVQAEMIRDLDGVRQVALHGSRAEIIFVAPLQHTDLEEQLYWVWLGWLEGDDNRPSGLYLAYQSFSAFAENDPNTESGLSSGNLDWRLLREQLLNESDQTLLFAGDFDGFELQYLKTDRDSPPDWETEWLEEDALPALLSIHFYDQARKQWPPIEVRPKVDAYAVKRLR